MSEHAERCAVTVGDATGTEDCGRPLPCKEHEQCHCGRERWAHSEHAFNQPSPQTSEKNIESAAEESATKCAFTAIELIAAWLRAQGFTITRNDRPEDFSIVFKRDIAAILRKYFGTEG